ncbi:hypothetical protein ACFLQ0_02510 [Nitrospinota bacterium]
MNSNAREWGVTILRLWMGFLIADTGRTMLGDLGLTSYLELKSASLEAWSFLGTALILIVGGAAIFLGIAVRLAAFLTALAAVYFLWGKVGTEVFKLLGYQIESTILVASVVFILIGPGRLNLGAVFRKR